MIRHDSMEFAKGCREEAKNKTTTLLAVVADPGTWKRFPH